MSLFGSIQMGGNTLRAMEIGLHVVGDNIANANTPGYVRQEAIFAPASTQKKGSLILGLGVTGATATWGNMLTNAQEYIFIAPWLALPPGFMIFITVLAFNYLGDGLRAALDPRSRL